MKKKDRKTKRSFFARRKNRVTENDAEFNTQIADQQDPNVLDGYQGVADAPVTPIKTKAVGEDYNSSFTDDAPETSFSSSSPRFSPTPNGMEVGQQQYGESAFTPHDQAINYPQDQHDHTSANYPNQPYGYATPDQYNQQDAYLNQGQYGQNPNFSDQSSEPNVNPSYNQANEAYLNRAYNQPPEAYSNQNSNAPFNQYPQAENYPQAPNSSSEAYWNQAPEPGINQPNQATWAYPDQPNADPNLNQYGQQPGFEANQTYGQSAYPDQGQYGQNPNFSDQSSEPNVNPSYNQTNEAYLNRAYNQPPEAYSNQNSNAPFNQYPQAENYPQAPNSSSEAYWNQAPEPGINQPNQATWAYPDQPNADPNLNQYGQQPGFEANQAYGQSAYPDQGQYGQNPNFSDQSSEPNVNPSYNQANEAYLNRAYNQPPEAYSNQNSNAPFNQYPQAENYPQAPNSSSEAYWNQAPEPGINQPNQAAWAYPDQPNADPNLNQYGQQPGFEANQTYGQSAYPDQGQYGQNPNFSDQSSEPNVNPSYNQTNEAYLNRAYNQPPEAYSNQNSNAPFNQYPQAENYPQAPNSSSEAYWNQAPEPGVNQPSRASGSYSDRHEVLNQLHDQQSSDVYSNTSADYGNVDHAKNENYKLAEMNTNLTKQILDRIDDIDDRIKKSEAMINQQVTSFQNQLADFTQKQTQNANLAQQYARALTKNNNDTKNAAYKLAEMNTNLTKQILDRIGDIDDRIKKNETMINQQAASLQSQLTGLVQTQRQGSYQIQPTRIVRDQAYYQPTVSPLTRTLSTPESAVSIPSQNLTSYQPTRYENSKANAICRLAEINANLTKQIIDRLGNIDDRSKMDKEQIDQQRINNEWYRMKTTTQPQPSQNKRERLHFSPKLALVADYPRLLNSDYTYSVDENQSAYLTPMAPPAGYSDDDQLSRTSMFPMSIKNNQNYYSERELASQRAINGPLPFLSVDLSNDELPYFGYSKSSKRK